MLERFKRKKPEVRQPQPAFKTDTTEIEDFKTMLGKQKCLGCGQNTFELQSYERGPDGFEVKIRCTNCLTNGTVNTLGFHFSGLSKKYRGIPVRRKP